MVANTRKGPWRASLLLNNVLNRDLLEKPGSGQLGTVGYSLFLLVHLQVMEVYLVHLRITALDQILPGLILNLFRQKICFRIGYVMVNKGFSRGERMIEANVQSP